MRLSSVALALRASVLLLLLSGVAESQLLTGTLFGTVKDQTGQVLPGALVQVSSPALIGGTASAYTDDKGQFRFSSLMPGEYTLEIALASFTTYREESIPMRVGGSLERLVELQLAGISAEVIVEGHGSAVEARRSGLSSRYGELQVKSIPTRRYSMFDFIKAAPGVSPTSPTSGTDNSVSVYGSGGNENLYLLDGTNFTCPCSGGAAPQPDVDVIQEIQIDSIGASAEYGNIQGAVINIVTKQGGDRFAFDASYYGQSDALTSHPVEIPCVRCSLPRTTYTRDKYHDSTTHLGGPLVRNRIWFFGGYQFLRDYDSQPGTDPLFPRTSEYDKVFAKATWQMTSRLRLMSSVHDEWWTNPERPTLSRPFETTLRVSGSRPTTTYGELTYLLSNNTMWDARFSRFIAPQTSEPSTGDRTIANRVELTTGIASGGPQTFGGLTLMRMAAKSSLTHYRSDLLGADHEFKIGAQLENGRHFGYTAIPSGARYTDNNGPFQAIIRDPFTSGGEFITTGVFASDAVRPTSRLTLNLGLRFDHNQAISQDLDARDLDGRKTGATIDGFGPLYSWNVLSPRLGVTLKLTGDGKTIARASWGRFHQGVLTGELTPIHPGLTPTTTAAYDPATGRYSRIISVVDPTINVRIDPNTNSPRTDHFGVGIDRELGHHMLLAASYVRKTGSDFIGWTDTGGVYRPQTRTLQDGRTVDVFVLANAAADRRFLLTNPPEYFLRYNGMMLALEKRWARGWQALASYTLSKTEGLQPSSGADPGGGQFSSTFGGGSLLGRDPNSLTNAAGRLANDRTHKLGLMGSMAIPKTGATLAANLQYYSGAPWAPTAQINLPQGLQRVLLEPAGSRRVSSQTLLDVRVSRTFALPGHARVDVLLDVLNALDDHAEERLADTNLFSQNFARPSALIDPRRAMIGVRLLLPN